MAMSAPTGARSGRRGNGPRAGLAAPALVGCLVVFLTVTGPGGDAFAGAATAAQPVRVMPVGDSVTSGGTHAKDSYRYRLYRRYAAAGVDWRPVGPFDGVHWEEQDPAVGYESWPRLYTRHAGRNGWSIVDLTPALAGWVEDAVPDVILALPAFARQGSVTEADFEAFLDAARSGSPDVKILFALPYTGSPNDPSVTAQYRARLEAVAAAEDTATSPVRLVDLAVGWDEDFHGGGGTLGRYPAEPVGNERVAMRWADALHRYWRIGSPWPTAAAPSLDGDDTGLSWAFDDAADEWEVERDGEIVATVPSVPGVTQTYVTTTWGSYRVRGIRSTATPDAPGGRSGPWSAPAHLGPEACPPERVPDSGFADTEGNVHRLSIDCVVWYGVAHGRSEASYRPSGPVRRDQMASFVARLIEEAGVALPVPESDRFSDIAGNVHGERINQLAAIGIVRGTSADTYGPDGPVRRDQMATFVAGAYEHIDRQSLPEAHSGFPDVTGNAHEANIRKIAGAGFASGRADGTYGPRAPVRRDQMASFLANVLRRLARDGRVEPPS